MIHALLGVLLAEGGGSALWAVLLGEGAPLIAALLVSLILARSGFHEKLNEYRQDTLSLVQMRSEAMEKQLAEAHGELEELRREARRRERHVEYLEMELEGHRTRPGRTARPARAVAKDEDEDDDGERAGTHKKQAHAHRGDET